jgi:hypothetical protein
MPKPNDTPPPLRLPSHGVGDKRDQSRRALRVLAGYRRPDFGLV